MSLKNFRALERAAVSDILTHASPLDRRQFFVSAAATAASVALPQSSRAQVLPTARCAISSAKAAASSRFRPAFAKDLSRLVDLNPFNQGGAYWNYSTLMTPVEDFFIRNEYPTPRPETEPRVDPEHWQLTIYGDGVDRPMTMTYDDLMKMPSRTIVSVMECAGNGRSLFWEQQDMTAGQRLVGGSGWGLGGIGQAEWEYVPIGHILDLVGLRKEAQWALFWSGIDSTVPGEESDTGRPVPVNLLRDRPETIGLAFKMNGKPLTPDHGAPVRALVPGWCGAASTKWLSEIKIATHNFWVPLNAFRHVMIGPDYEKPQPRPGDEFRFVKPEQVKGPMVTWLPAKSLITVPLVLEKQPKFPHNYPLAPGQRPQLSAGPQVVRGYAWAPQAGVRKVHYRINNGNWSEARIMDQELTQYSWVRFSFPWDPAVGSYTVETRVTDRRGKMQPASVPYNQGGFDFHAIPKFHIDVV